MHTFYARQLSMAVLLRGSTHARARLCDKRPGLEILVWTYGTNLETISVQHLSKLPSWLSSLLTKLMPMSCEIFVVNPYLYSLAFLFM